MGNRNLRGAAPFLSMVFLFENAVVEAPFEDQI